MQISFKFFCLPYMALSLLIVIFTTTVPKEGLTLSITTPFPASFKFSPFDFYYTKNRNKSRNVRATSDEKTDKIMPMKIHSFRVDSHIQYRYSTTHITSRMTNEDSNWPQRATFTVMIPKEAFVSKFSMEIDGKTYDAYVEENDEAERMETSGQENPTAPNQLIRDSKVFTVNVDIQPKGNVQFHLIYEEQLARTDENYQHNINFISEQTKSVEDFQICVKIHELRNIQNLTVRNLRNGAKPSGNETVIQNNMRSEGNGNIAEIVWKPTRKDKENLSRETNGWKYVVMYDTEKTSNSGELLELGDYFVHYFYPQVLPLRMHVVFVLDVSSSMEGTNLKKMKESQKKLLDDLLPDDYFNIITFHSDVHTWIPEAENNTPTPPFPGKKEYYIEAAKKYIGSLEAHELTNMHDAMITAINLISIFRNSPQHYFTVGVESIIIFLTDGMPTVGITNPSKIQQSIKTANQLLKIPIFTIAFGDQVDFEFLQKISTENFGSAKKIFQTSDATSQLNGLYNEISRPKPILKNVEVKYTSSEYSLTDVTTSKFQTIYKGNGIVIAGKRLKQEEPKEIFTSDDYTLLPNDEKRENSDNSINVNITGSGRDGNISLESPTVFCETDHVHHIPKTKISKYNELKIIERFWAFLKIKQLIGIETNVVNDVKFEENTKKEALKLAVQYGFVTPVTSLVILKPDGKTRYTFQTKSLPTTTTEVTTTFISEIEPETTTQKSSTNNVNTNKTLDKSLNISKPKSAKKEKTNVVTKAPKISTTKRPATYKRKTNESSVKTFNLLLIELCLLLITLFQIK